MDDPGASENGQSAGDGNDAQSAPFAGPGSSEPSSSSLWPGIIMSLIALVLVRKLLMSGSQATTRFQAPLPTREELRAIRAARLVKKAKDDENQVGAKPQQLNDVPQVVAEKAPRPSVPARAHRRPTRRTVTADSRVWKPIKSASELLSWSAASEPIMKTKPLSCVPLEMPQPPRKKLLVVHDMAGNYAEDAFVDGWYPTTADEAQGKWVWGFRPMHMQFTDTFVYFSHSLVSIPPRGWIESAHRHGSKVLGTFLTEWDEGIRACSELFASEETMQKTAKQLCSIAVELGFDGWLINIENPLCLVQVDLMQRFLQELSTFTTDADGTSRTLVIIWYDSVISSTGQLRWQNALNSENVAFFNKTNGGILTNYGWQEERLKVSHLTVDQTGRSRDLLWHGIDCFGRGTFGGGGMKCDLALNVIERYGGSSACLFAPGWVLENAAERNPQLGRRKNIEFFNSLLFNSAWGDALALLQFDLTRRAFYTDFCDGGGSSYWLRGERVSSLPWLDLSRQRTQPRWDIITPIEYSDEVAQKRMTLRCVDTGVLFQGSNAIQVVGRRTGLTSEEWCFFPILNLSCRLGGELGPSSKLRITAAVLGHSGDGAIALLIRARDPLVTPNSQVILVPPGFTSSTSNCLEPVSEVVVKGWKLRTWELRTYELRGRHLVGVGFSPLPMKAGPIAATWVDIRLGMLCLDETSHSHPDCAIESAVLDEKTLFLSWECCCGGSDSCAIDHVAILVNGKFRQACGRGDGPVRLTHVSVSALNVIEDVITLVGCRRDGSLTSECRANLSN